MKSSIKFLLLSSVMAGFTSACTDLDINIDAQYTTYPDNPIALSAKLEGCYYYLQNEAGLGRNYWEGVMLQGDELMGICFNGGYYDNGRLFFPTTHDLKNDTPGVGQMGDLMSGCSYCNSVIMELTGEAESEDPLIAPVRAIRAFYHFMMMDLYGDTPILSHSLQEGEVINRSPRAEVAQWIEKELLAVIPQLTEENNANTYGRPNKWMAEALLVKLYLNWGVYTCGDVKSVTVNTPNEKLNECIAWCDSITDSGIFEVGKGYRQKFFPNNGVQIKDFIYAMNFDPVANPTKYIGGHQLDRFMTFKKANDCDNGPWGFKPSKSVAGAYVLVPECVERFNLPGDERNQMILGGPQYIFDYTNNYTLTDQPLMYQGQQVIYKQLETSDFMDPTLLDVGADSEPSNIMKGYHLGKYPSIPDDFNLRDRVSGNDIPIFRYADILLTKAECILRGANATRNDTPASLINQVRDCSNAPHIAEGDVTMQELLDERGREFICEMWRRQDLIRFGQFENDWGWKHTIHPEAKTELWRRVMPIPLGVMETNTNWKQNEGY